MASITENGHVSALPFARHNVYSMMNGQMLRASAKCAPSALGDSVIPATNPGTVAVVEACVVPLLSAVFALVTFNALVGLWMARQ